LGKKPVHQDWHNLENRTIPFIIKESGIISTFLHPVPLYAQIQNSLAKKAGVVTVRLFDADPSLVTEDFVSKVYTKEIIEGAAIIAKAAGLSSAVIAYPAGNTSLLQNEEEIKALFEDNVNVVFQPMDTKKYPCGTMHDIVTAVKKSFPKGEFARFGKNDLFLDSTTALNVYNALVLDRPVLRSFVHVTGDCLNASAIMNVKIGTPLKALVEQCGGFKRPLSKIIINGMIMGTAVSSLDIPVSSSIKSVEFIPVHQVKMQRTESCVRCGNCRKICPVGLWPGNLYRIAHLSEQGQDNSFLNGAAFAKASLLCTECGLCNSVCPSRLPLKQTISLLKHSNIEDESNEK